MFKGVNVAIATPMIKGQVDYESLKKVIQLHKDNQTQAITVIGTTGEPATLSVEEKLKIIQFVIDETKNTGIKIIAGASSNNTQAIVEFMDLLNPLKTDGVMVVTPFYNKTSQHGLVEHYSYIASKHPNTPIMLYDVPGRTGMSMHNKTILELAQIDNIVGYKDGRGDILAMGELIHQAQDKIAIFSASDALSFPSFCLGSSGVVSVVGNIIPLQMKMMYDFFASGNITKSREIYNKYFSLFQGVFMDISPVPIKYALFKMKITQTPDLRLPLVPMKKEDQSIFEAMLKKYELI